MLAFQTLIRLMKMLNVDTLLLGYRCPKIVTINIVDALEVMTSYSEMTYFVLFDWILVIFSDNYARYTNLDSFYFDFLCLRHMLDMCTANSCVSKNLSIARGLYAPVNFWKYSYDIYPLSATVVTCRKCMHSIVNCFSLF